MPRYFIFLIIILALQSCNYKATIPFSEKYRGQVHFSPRENWMNGPAGLICVNNQYHLLYPCNPTDKTGVSTHLGHAVSSDMIHWEHLPVALSPDNLGSISSGCIVFDENNTSGFGTDDNPPLIIIYTCHDFESESSGSLNVESQGIAYSLDNGSTWIKYDNNPVIPHPGFRDFRHPKVYWDEQNQQWKMVIAADNRIHFYNSENLKEWRYISDFGNRTDNEYNLWESPDLFQMQVKDTDETRWVLMVSIGFGDTGEWGTGYYTGRFEENHFLPDQSSPLWIDYGQDNYAGITYSGIPDQRTVFIGWMNNWEYAAEVPTQTWHGSMTFPRDLVLEKIDGHYILTSQPIKEIKNLYTEQVRLSDITVVQDIEQAGIYNITPQIHIPISPSEVNIRFKTDNITRMGFAEKFGIRLSNEKGEFIIIGYDCFRRSFYVDRSSSTSEKFSDKFTGKHILPFDIDGTEILEMNLILDKTSFELFTMNGKVVMTDTFYPTSDFNQIEIFAENGRIILDSIAITGLKSIWELDSPIVR